MNTPSHINTSTLQGCVQANLLMGQFSWSLTDLFCPAEDKQVTPQSRKEFHKETEKTDASCRIREFSL